MISSAQRALRVLEAVGRATDPVGVTEIARQLSLQPGTVFRSLDALEQSGYIKRFQSSSKYVLGITVSQLRQALLSRFKIRDASIPYLRQLAFASGENVGLVARLGWYGLRIAAAAGTNDVTSSPPTGQITTLEHTCAGRAILAFLPENEIATYRKWAREGKAAVLTKALVSELQTIQQRRYAIEVTRFAQGRASIAFPIHGVRGPIAAIAVDGPVFRINQPDKTRLSHWLEIVQALQTIVSDRPNEFEGPFAQLSPANIKLSPVLPDVV